MAAGLEGNTPACGEKYRTWSDDTAHATRIWMKEERQDRLGLGFNVT